MDILIGWQEFKTKFKDKDVSMELLPLSSGELVKVSKFMVQDGVKEKFDIYGLLEPASDIFTNHVKDLKAGFTVGGGALEIKHLWECPAIAALSFEIIGRLSTISMLTDEEIKNSEPSSVVQEQESEQTELSHAIR